MGSRPLSCSTEEERLPMRNLLRSKGMGLQFVDRKCGFFFSLFRCGWVELMETLSSMLALGLVANMLLVVWRRLLKI